jgi:hypothetical protein
LNKKIRIKEVVVDGFIFPGYDGLVWHSGEFWMDSKPIKKVYNNGSISILLYGCSKKSIKQLRKIAIPCRIKIQVNTLPF